MIFNSFDFIWIIPIILFVYFLIQQDRIRSFFPKKIGNAFLILVSYLLYIKWNPVYSLILLFITATTYLSAKKIDKDQAFGKKKYLIWTGVILSTIPLIFFKYYNFLIEQFNALFSTLGLEVGLPGINLIMPLGLSYFTLQAIGYLIDVYLQRIKVEHNWCDYMLFVCFFPQLASGPISKAADLLPQIKQNRIFSETQFIQGCKWILWGMFMKVVVADRLGLVVNDAYVHMLTNSGGTLFFSSIFYTIEIYCDFAGYSFMALGVGELFGFELVNNFRQPFFSQSITEFWGRWHISLSTWLKYCVYIPLGGNRCSKAKNYLNIIVTFIVSGLWHGANWTFVVWGCLHGFFQVIEKMLGLNVLKSTGLRKGIRVFVTFMLFNFSMIFFRMSSIKDAIYVVRKIFTDFSFNLAQWSICLLLTSIVLFKDIMDAYDIKPLRLLHSRYTVIRWTTYLFLIFSIMVFGVYGGQFIYSGF